ncbi:MAG: 3-hydroxy-3-methylglutaryl CoA synthase [Acidimicrobiales bacterium]|nr:3-hydroxy-3-methylglutaryl CoA synthase [Acidimicrobiales bacterium]
MRGILGWGVHVPYRRLDRTGIAPVAGLGGGKGTRSVACFDEDTTSMAVEAARAAVRSAPDVEPASVWFATVAPPYLDKTNATAIHAALRLPRSAPAYDAIGSMRSTLGALRAALGGRGAALVAAADLRSGLPGSGDEATGGDGAAAVLVGDDGDGPVLAEVVAWSTATEEFLDRWRTPGESRSKLWEEKFGELHYTELGVEAFNAALKDAGLTAEEVDHLVVVGTHDRAVRGITKKLGVPPDRLADDFSATVGNTGAAHPLLLLAATLEKARPGQTLALLTLSDGADAIIFKTTGALADHRVARTVAAQVGAGGPIAYGKFLSWRGLLNVEPPRRPEPSRTSSSAAGRNLDWKFAFVGSEAEDGTIRLPPSPNDPTRHAMAEAIGTIVTYTVDRLAYSPSPPIVFAVVDFDGGGRLPIELTDVDDSEVSIGMKVEMTFRRLFTADGIHNYFWKARPVRGEGG